LKIQGLKVDKEKLELKVYPKTERIQNVKLTMEVLDFNNKRTIFQSTPEPKKLVLMRKETNFLLSNC